MARKLRIGLCFGLWVVLPAALFTPSDTIPFPTLAASLFHFNLYALAAGVGLYFTLTYLLMGYGLYTGHALDARFLLDSCDELPTTLQPYSDAAIVAVRREQKHTYHLASGRLTRAELRGALVEGPAEVVAEQLAYARLAAEHGCARYRATHGPR